MATLGIKEKLDEISKYIPGKASDIAAMLDVHVNTLKNMKADGYSVSVIMWDKIEALHKKAMKIKRIAGDSDE
jgi:hypothetical protein